MCVCPPPSGQLLKILIDFHIIWKECYITGEHPLYKFPIVSNYSWQTNLWGGRDANANYYRVLKLCVATGHTTFMALFLHNVKQPCKHFDSVFSFITITNGPMKLGIQHFYENRL
jgi:hypothetical protein